MEIPVVSLGRKLSPYLKIAAAIVLVVLISLAGIRLFSWHAQGEQTRLITLVNPWNPVTETGYSVKLTGAEDGFHQALRQGADVPGGQLGQQIVEPRMRRGTPAPTGGLQGGRAQSETDERIPQRG